MNSTTLDALFKLETSISSRKIVVVDDHHKAFAAWALYRRSVAAPPNLISLDHHPDTMPAFRRHPSVIRCGGESAREAARQRLIQGIRWDTDSGVIDTIGNLHHDEQIAAATNCGVLNYAFSIQLLDSGGTQSIEEDAGLSPGAAPLTFSGPEDRAFSIGSMCAVGCQKAPHDDDCLILHSDQVLESVFLDEQLARGADMARSVGFDSAEALPYILDVDLDFFHTRRSLTPKDPGTFYRLVRNAVLITIATEEECLADGWLDNERISVCAVLEAVRHHIETALQ